MSKSEQTNLDLYVAYGSLSVKGESCYGVIMGLNGVIVCLMCVALLYFL